MHAIALEPDAVVVGGGLAGLTAAIFLGRAGLRVTLLERNPTLGGRAATRDRGGFRFNLGPHAIYSGGATTRTLEELDVRYTQRSPSPPLLLDNGRLHSMLDPRSFVGSALFNPLEALELTRFLIGIARADPAAVARQSVQSFVDERVRGSAVGQFVKAFAKTLVYSDALDLASAEVFVDKLKRQFSHPVQYVNGGWGVLVDGLRRAADAMGVELRANAAVDQISAAEGHVQGVRLRGGECIPTNFVVLATTPKDAKKLLSHLALTRFQAKLDALVPIQVAALDIALKRLPKPRHAVVQDLNLPRFMSAQSRFVTVAPTGADFVTSFKQLDPRLPTDPHLDERELEGLLDLAQAGWRNLEIERNFLPRIEAVGALPTAATGGFAGRPDVNAAELEGLYVAGDWVGSEGFLSDACFASARRAATLLIEQHGKRQYSAATVRS